MFHFVRNQLPNSLAEARSRDQSTSRMSLAQGLLTRWCFAL